MTDLSLGFSALTTASHVCLVLSIVLVFSEAQRVCRRPEMLEAVTKAEMPRSAVFLALATVIVERCYYVAARLLEPSGLNLWAEHPAPELLSALVALSIFGIVVSTRVATRQFSDDWLPPVIAQAAFLAVVWAAVAAVLF